MKTTKSILFAITFILGIYLSGCEQNSELPQPNDSILPESFSVDIPDAISRSGATNARMADVDTIKGNDIYEHLGNFIAIGESAAEIVEDIIYSIATYQINRPMILTYQSDEDQRSKTLRVQEKIMFESQEWDYSLTITDSDSEGNPDGGKAIQIFWNLHPLKGVALLKPYNIDRLNDEGLGNAIFRIDYSETGEHGYDAHMIVSIAELPLPTPLKDPFAMSTLKMFVGKKGDIVDVYGNSNHPNATFFTGSTGFNWAFVASGNEKQDIGVAEVGLPPSMLDEPGRKILLEYYSIKDVFTREIYQLWPNIPEDDVQAFLYNTAAPGYFNQNGFISGGTSPGSEYDPLVKRLDQLSPYNPKQVSQLTINFQ